MSTPRVAIFTRRFWPLCGEAESAIADLAVGLRDMGNPATIVTAQWRKDWPKQFAYESVPVVRLPKPSGRWWGDWSYARRLSRWLHGARNDFDVIIADRPGHDASALVNAVRHATISTIVLTPRECPARLPAADAIVVDDEAARESLSALKIPLERIHAVAPGVPIPIAGTREDRRNARISLAKACGDPGLRFSAPLAIAVERFERDRGLETLLTAWAQVARGWPDARLWIFGEGPERAALLDTIDRLKLRERVFMPGVMENMDELLLGADLYVTPNTAAHPSYFLRCGMAAGKAILASDTPAHRRLLSSNEHGLLFEPGEADDAAVAIERLFSQPTLAGVLGAGARRRAIEEFAVGERVAKFGELFEQLVAARDRVGSPKPCP